MLIICQVGCGNDKMVYKEYQNVSGEVWRWDDLKTFEFNITSKEVTYNRYIHLRLTDNYPKANIYLKSMLIHDNDSVKHLHNIKLFSPEGVSEGKKGSKFISYRVNLFKNQRLKAGKYKVVLEQHTRVFDLKGVNAVGYEIEKGEPVF